MVCKFQQAAEKQIAWGFPFLSVNCRSSNRMRTCGQYFWEGPVSCSTRVHCSLRRRLPPLDICRRSIDKDRRQNEDIDVERRWKDTSGDTFLRHRAGYQLSNHFLTSHPRSSHDCTSQTWLRPAAPMSSSLATPSRLLHSSSSATPLAPLPPLAKRCAETYSIIRGINLIHPTKGSTPCLGNPRMACASLCF